MHPNSDVSVLGYQSPRITPRLFTQLAGASADQPLFEQILALSTSLQIERDAARPEDEPSDALDPTQDRASPSTARERSTDQRPTSDAAPETAASRDDPAEDGVPVLAQVVDFQFQSRDGASTGTTEAEATVPTDHAAEGASPSLTVAIDGADAAVGRATDESARELAADDSGGLIDAASGVEPSEVQAVTAGAPPVRSEGDPPDVPTVGLQNADRSQTPMVNKEEPEDSVEPGDSLPEGPDVADPQVFEKEARSDPRRRDAQSRKWWEGGNDRQPAIDPVSLPRDTGPDPAGNRPPEVSAAQSFDSVLAAAAPPSDVAPAPGNDPAAASTVANAVIDVAPVPSGTAVPTVDSGDGSTPSATVAEGGRARTAASRPDRGRAAGPEAGQADSLSRQQQVRLVQRIARSFQRLTPHGGQITLRLHPPQLGALAMRVRIEGRSLEARLTAETPAARDAILENLPALRTRLADQGFEISQFQVEVGNNGSDAASGDGRQPPSDLSSGGREHQPHRRPHGVPSAARPESEGAIDANARQTTVVYAGLGIDIHA